VLELDKDSLMPLKEKMSKMTVQLDKARGGTEIAEVTFNMTDFSYGEYKYATYSLKRLGDFEVDESEAVLEVGLRGKKEDGLVQKRMSAIKSSMDSGIKDLLKGAASGDKRSQSNKDIKDLLAGVQTQELF
jgi:hypothetical protein